jgi:hypothetical protein
MEFNSINKVATENGYEYWQGKDDVGHDIYNIVLIGEPSPTAGYYNADTLCKLKGVHNYFLPVLPEPLTAQERWTLLRLEFLNKIRKINAEMSTDGEAYPPEWWMQMKDIEKDLMKIK